MTEGTAGADLSVTLPAAEAAAARLTELQANPEWRAKLLSKDGGAAEKKEFSALMLAKSGGGDRLDKIIDGTAEVPWFETVINGQLSTYNQLLAASWLKEAGIEPDAIKQVFRGEPVARAEYEAAVTLRKDLMADAEFRKSYLSGNREAVRQMQLLNIVITCGFKNEKAAAA